MKNIQINIQKAGLHHFIEQASFQASARNKPNGPLKGTIGCKAISGCAVVCVLESGVVRKERDALFNKHMLEV